VINDNGLDDKLTGGTRREGNPRPLQPPDHPQGDFNSKGPSGRQEEFTAHGGLMELRSSVLDGVGLNVGGCL
jgi:hypothetical protein